MRIPIPAAPVLASCAALFLTSGPSPRGLHPNPWQQESRQPENRDATLSPYFWIKSEDPTVDQLPLKSTRAQVSIAGVIADVKVTQVYKNAGKKPIEAVYVFPGSTRAAVYGMRMTIGERTLEARIRERSQARQDYEHARQEGRTASLLEQQRPNVFQMNVANILPGDEIKVELSYTELLVPREGTYEFVYPTVVGPRYSGIPGTDSSAGEPWVANPYTKEGEAPMSTFDLELKLAAGMPIQRMACETHKNAIAYNGAASATLKLDPSEKQGGNRDFVLRYQLAGGKVQSGLLLYKGQEENFFLLMMQPPSKVQTATIPPREYVFIMDVSGSMHGYPLETSKALMRDLVGHLRPEDRFNLEVFESGSAVWSPEGSRPATPENLRSALAFVGSQNGGGGTEILPALQRALNLPKAEGCSRTFVIATDGYISVEPKVLDVVRKGLGNANMFAFGIGSSVNRYLVEGIAHAGMGEPFVITKPEEAGPQAERFRQYVSSPVLTQVKASFKDFQAYDVEPLSIPDVLADRPVLVFGKWKGEARGSIQVSGRNGAGPYAQTFRVDAASPMESNAALRYLWARHRIQLLGDYGSLGDGSQKQTITELGLKYGLLTSYTSFVAIDSLVRNQGGQSTQVNQPLPLPEGVSNLAVGQPACAPVAFTVGGSAAPRASKARQEAYACAEVVGTSQTELQALHDTAAMGLSASPAGPQGASPEPPESLPQQVTGTAFEAQVLAWLKEPRLARILSTAPGTATLELRVDATGKIIGARFTRSFQGADRVARALLQRRLTGWTRGGTATLQVPVRSPQAQ